MHFFTGKHSIVCRTLLGIGCVVAIPILLLACMFQRAGGSRDKYLTNYTFFLFIPLLLFIVYVMYVRTRDKKEKRKSNTFFMYCDMEISSIGIILSLIALCSTCWWMFEKQRFEFQTLNLPVAILFISFEIAIDNLKDWTVLR